MNKQKEKAERPTSASRNAGVEGREIMVYWSKTRRKEKKPSDAVDPKDTKGSVYHKGIVRQVWRGYWIVDYNLEKGRIQETDKLDFVNKCSTSLSKGDKKTEKDFSWPWLPKGLMWMLNQTSCDAMQK